LIDLNITVKKNKVNFMNAFAQQELLNDDSGLLEVCDFCGKLIFNWDWLEMATVHEDGRIICKHCLTEHRSLGILISRIHCAKPLSMFLTMKTAQTNKLLN
jgi:hypothetical protein